jgi:hypothetical protein
MSNRARVDLTAAIEGADSGQEIAEREDAASPRDGSNPKRVGHLLDAAPRLDERDERFPLADLVGLHPREIFEHRRFERVGVVALVEDGAGNGFRTAPPSRATAPLTAVKRRRPATIS